MSSIKRSQSMRRPAAPSSAVTTRSTTRAAASSSTAAADSRPQSRTSSPTVPSTRPYSRTISSSSNAGGSSARSTSARPFTRSLSSASVGRPSPTTTAVTTTTTRHASTTGTKELPSRKESSRYPPSTTLTRPPVVPRPRSSTGMSSTAPPPVTKLPTQPSRPRSSATTNLPSASAIRPPTLRGRQPGSSIPGGGVTAAVTATPASPAAAAQRRIISVGKSVTTHPPRPPSVTSTASSAPTPAPPQPRIRPGFSTVQRHYSPVRSPAPKLSSANPLTPLTPPALPKSPANVAPPVEIAKLQAELLQLYLLHSEAASADEQWNASAKAKLGERFLKLRDENNEATERERAAVERANVLALGRWGAGGGLDERIQALEAIITGVWSLSDPGGRYARVVRRFEHWIDNVTDIQEARRRADGLSHLQVQDALFIEELDEAWKEERQGLLQRLSGWKTQLDEIDDLPDQHRVEDSQVGRPGKSGLKRMLEGSRSLIDDMLAELDMMTQIEQEAIESEEQWIQRMNRMEDHECDGPRAGAAWRNL